MPRPRNYISTPTRLVLRVLLDATDQVWTGEIARRADVPMDTTSHVLKRLLSNEWVTSSRESREAAAARPSAPRRYYEFTAAGREAALEVLGRSRTPPAPGQDQPQPPTRGAMGLEL